MARASGREKSESGPAGRLFPAAFLRRPALGDGGPPASGTVVLVPRPAELLALVSPPVLASGTVRRSAASRSESGATARPGMRAMRSEDSAHLVRQRGATAARSGPPSFHWGRKAAKDGSHLRASEAMDTVIPLCLLTVPTFACKPVSDDSRLTSPTYRLRHTTYQGTWSPCDEVGTLSWELLQSSHDSVPTYIRVSVVYPPRRCNRCTGNQTCNRSNGSQT